MQYCTTENKCPALADRFDDPKNYTEMNAMELENLRLISMEVNSLHRLFREISNYTLSNVNRMEGIAYLRNWLKSCIELYFINMIAILGNYENSKTYFKKQIMSNSFSVSNMGISRPPYPNTRSAGESKQNITLEKDLELLEIQIKKTEQILLNPTSLVNLISYLLFGWSKDNVTHNSEASINFRLSLPEDFEFTTQLREFIFVQVI